MSQNTESTTLNLESLQQQYNNILVSYQQAYQTLINSIQNQDQNSVQPSVENNYLTNVQSLGAQLVDLNNQIINILKNQGPTHHTELQNRETTNDQLQSNLQELHHQQSLVNKSIDDYQSLENEISDTGLSTQQNYMKYVLYFIILVVVIILFFKYVLFSKSGQSGGGVGGKYTKMEEIIFLLGLMIVFLGLGFFFKENAGFIIITLVILLYVFIKMKWIPNFLKI